METVIEQYPVLLQYLRNVLLKVLNDLDGELLSFTREDSSVYEAVGTLANLLQEVVLQVSILWEAVDISRGQHLGARPTSTALPAYTIGDKYLQFISIIPRSVVWRITALRVKTGWPEAEIVDRSGNLHYAN